MHDQESGFPDALVPPGQVILLHGSPRSGKSSILKVIQDSFHGSWMNLGFDTFIFQVRPKHYLPGEKFFRLGPHYWEYDADLDNMRHVLGGHSAPLIAGLYASIAAHSRLGFNVVADVVHPDVSHRQIFEDAMQSLAGLPVLIVGVYCPLEAIIERRRTPDQVRATVSADQPVPPIVYWWDREIHVGKTYDLEVDTSVSSPKECAAHIRNHLANATRPTVFETLRHQLP